MKPFLLGFAFTIAVLLMADNAFAVSLYADDGTYLGELNQNRYDPNSVANPYGKYGSKYQPDSINNPYGRYGSPYSSESPNNPYATSHRRR